MPGKKYVCAALLAAMTAGCAAVAPDLGYAPAATTASGLRLQGELVDLTDLKIFVDGQKVIDGQLTLSSGAGTFLGTYQGQHVRAQCSSRSGLALAKTRCIVSVGNETGTLLSF